VASGSTVVNHMLRYRIGERQPTEVWVMGQSFGSLRRAESVERPF
jgi:hypothetical protein